MMERSVINDQMEHLRNCIDRVEESYHEYLEMARLVGGTNSAGVLEHQYDSLKLLKLKVEKDQNTIEVYLAKRVVAYQNAEKE